MKYVPALLIAGLLAGVLPTVAQAETIKPGLWEFKQTPQLDATRQAQLAQAQKAMENMPPERRALIEQMMAKQGLNISIAGGVITAKACITQEQVERNLLPLSQRGNCTQQSSRNGNVIQSRFVCTDPASEGDATVMLRSSESFTNDVVVRMQRQDKTETVKVTGEGRWLGADCGGVQPAKIQDK